MKILKNKKGCLHITGVNGHRVYVGEVGVYPDDPDTAEQIMDEYPNEGWEVIYDDDGDASPV